MSTVRRRLDRLEPAVPVLPAAHDYDLGRRTVAQRKRMAEIRELTDEEVQDGAAIVEV